jgi:hypothetical protein
VIADFIIRVNNSLGHRLSIGGNLNCCLWKYQRQAKGKRVQSDAEGREIQRLSSQGCCIKKTA